MPRRGNCSTQTKLLESEQGRFLPWRVIQELECIQFRTLTNMLPILRPPNEPVLLHRICSSNASYGWFICLLESGTGRLCSIHSSQQYSPRRHCRKTTLLNRQPDSLRIRTKLKEGFNLLHPIAVAVLVIASALAMVSTKMNSIFNWVGSVVNSAVIVFVIIAGFLHKKTSNLSPVLPYAARGIFQAAAIVYFAYRGFHSIATMAEETRNPARDIPIGLLGSMSCIIVVYCLMALSLSVIQPYTETIQMLPTPLHFRWARSLVALGALKGMTTVLLVGALGQAWYTTHVPRAHMIPPWFAHVHPKTSTTINATLLNTILSICIAFFSSLDMLTSLLSISRLCAYREKILCDPRRNLLKLTILLLIIIAASMGPAACWSLHPYSWLGYVVTIPYWFFSTMGMWILLHQQNSPKFWGVPCVPWLPSFKTAHRPLHGFQINMHKKQGRRVIAAAIQKDNTQYYLNVIPQIFENHEDGEEFATESSSATPQRNLFSPRDSDKKHDINTAGEDNFFPQHLRDI
ncbi:hypothetical protein Cgig2_030719 [Carnegiea gigantea]|uniref:Amino acid permease/ SLC12A domain-containing protein n=1 Tax=Carnegiea gigantea TaxID=171969 RepID=A0A9Q1QD27_9CARY|nr:hypothetical protein Cgig2_030719 [Carnegiea gigantea]